MIKNNKKGDDKMEHKDLWLVLGLTVILAVAVSLSTVSLTGNAIFSWGKTTVTKAPTTVNPQLPNPTPVTWEGIADMLNKVEMKKVDVTNGGSAQCNQICQGLGKKCVNSFSIMKQSTLGTKFDAGFPYQNIVEVKSGTCDTTFGWSSNQPNKLSYETWCGCISIPY